MLGISVQAIRKNAAAGKYPNAHKIAGNGGEGWAIPLSDLPGDAQARYWQAQYKEAGFPAMRSSGSTFAPEEREAHWRRYEKATEKCKARANHAFAALLRFRELLRQGVGKIAAYAVIKANFGAARSTFNDWQQAVEGLDQGDWLPALTPGFGGWTNARTVEWPGDSWTFFVNHATAPGCPLKTAYKRMAREAEAQGWGPLPSFQTARRHFANMPAGTKAVLRGDETELKRLSPTVHRDYSAFALHEQWSMDGRRMDLMICDRKGEFGEKGRRFRPWLYAVMDMRSRYLVGYALGDALNADFVRAALLNAFKTTGRIAPKIVQVDNGMEAAAKEITGGAPWRRRGKVKPDEIIGLLPLLGIDVSWATPGHGQTKPVERLFGTLARMCETRPEFRGAYCGHTPEARPEEWDAEKAVDFHVAKEIFTEEFSAYIRAPHSGDSMDGKSPLQVYSELMNASSFVPRQLSEQQLRVCALSAVPVTIRADGRFSIMGAMYYSVQTADLPKGRGYYARYNPHDLADPVHVYRGAKMVAEKVPQQTRIAGNDKESAKRVAKERTVYLKAKKAEAKAIKGMQRLDPPAEIAKRIADKHPELIDTETGEIKRLAVPEAPKKLPVSKVVGLIQPAAEMPREPGPAEVEEAARVKVLADDMARFNAEKNRVAMGRRGRM